MGMDDYRLAKSELLERLDGNSGSVGNNIKVAVRSVCIL
jgi:hypothetical protein